MEWKVFLPGDEFDLLELSKSLCSPDLAVTRDEDDFVLRSSRLSDLHDADALRREAENIVMLLDGAARVVLHTRVPIAVGSIVLIRDDGSKGYFENLGVTLHVRTGASVVLKRADGSEEQFNQADPVVGWVNAGLGNEAVARVLGLFATKAADWVNLYRILEVVESDMGGRDSIVQQGWVTSAELRRFKHSANSPSAIGDDARHGKESTKPPPDPMTLTEARSFVETILHNWLRTKHNP